MNFPNIEDGDEIVLDTETDGVDWQVNKIVGFVITLPHRGENYYYPIRHETGDNMSPDVVINWVKSWAGKKILIVGHNLKFDLHMCANDGIFFPQASFEDTQINATLIDEHIGSYSMDNVAKYNKIEEGKVTDIYQYLADKFGGNPDKKQMGNFWRLDARDPKGTEYALGDGTTTWKIYLLQKEVIAYQQLEKVHAVECKLVPVLFKMERRGVPVSMENLEKLKVYIDRKLEAARGLLPLDFNPRSPNQVADVLSSKEGIPNDEFPRTPLGNLSFTEPFLKGFATGRAIINVRKLTNLQNTFIKGSVEDKIYRGRIHCNFNQMFDGDFGTHTGRLSSNGPNMQQVPKRDKVLAPIFRRIFVPETGLEWNTRDYSQQEYRIFATYANSTALIEAYRNGGDMHQQVADDLGVERDPTAKRLNLGMLYWMGAPKLAGMLGISEEQAQAYRDLYNQRIPEVMQFLKRCQATGRSRGYVLTILNRRQRFPRVGDAYKGSSRVISGTCADIMKAKMVEVNEYLESETRGESGLVLQVHDSLDWFLPPEMKAIADEATRIMTDLSTVSPTLVGKVPMLVDSASGPTWGHASFPKQDWSIYEEEVSGDELSDEVED